MDEQNEAIRRQLALASPAGLAWYTSRGRWRLAPHLSVLNRYLLLLAASRRSGPGKGIDRLIIDMPPRHGKSEMVSKHFPSWWMATFCDRVMLASYEASFAASWGAKNRDIMREHAGLLNLQLVGSQMANNFEVARPNDLSYRGGMMTAGVGGGFTGKGAQLLIIDDPLKNAEEANSVTMRTKAVDWWESTAQTRLEPGGVAVLIMTRWHEDDLAGHLLADLNETGDKWALLSFPAIAETEENFFNGLYHRSPGEALWPSRYPLERLLRLKGGMASYWWNSLYQQHPQPAEGGLFKREDLLYFSQAWRHEPDKSVATFVLHRKTGDQIFDKSECRWFLTVDLAASLKESADFTVIGTWAVTPQNDLLLESIVRKRMEGPDQLNKIVEIWNKTQPDYVGVEAVAYQLTAVQNLRRLGIPTRELEADKDKYSRAITASVLTEGGKFFMAKGAEWVADFEQELLTFPKGAHDDQVDVFSYAAEQITMHSGLGVYLP